MRGSRYQGQSLDRIGSKSEQSICLFFVWNKNKGNNDVADQSEIDKLASKACYRGRIFPSILPS